MNRTKHKIQPKADNFTTIKVGRRAIVIWTDYSKNKSAIVIRTIGFKDVRLESHPIKRKRNG